MLEKVLEWTNDNGESYDLVVEFTSHAKERSFERFVGYDLIKAAFEASADELYDVLDGERPIETEVLLRWQSRHTSLALVVMGYDENYRLVILIKTAMNFFKKNPHVNDVVIDL